MKTYIISYDLRNYEKYGDYEILYKAIKSYGTWAKILESVWAIKTNDSAKNVRNNLKSKIDSDDGLFVIKSGVESAWSNVICSNQWLKDNL